MILIHVVVLILFKTEKIESVKPIVVSNQEVPLRPLSAYNYFFRDERDRILTYGPSYDKEALLPSMQKQYYTNEHQESLMRAYWNQDHSTKRKHRKSHGKISFTELSKTVSKRWKALSKDEKGFYQQVATKDWERYQNDLIASMKTRNYKF
jgi:HMG (high mobility group) box